jgi:uncharacterized protein (DUF3820 family)
MQPYTEILKGLVTKRMPSGEYKELLLCHLPDAYLEWFTRTGFPKGMLGMQLQTVCKIKLNGLTDILV